MPKSIASEPERQISGAIRKIGEFCSSLYRDGIEYLGGCYRSASKNLRERSGYKISLGALPLGIGSCLASQYVGDPAFGDLLNNIGYGFLGAGGMSFVEEYFNGKQRIKERKYTEERLRKVQSELKAYRRQFGEQLNTSRQLKKLVRELIREERRQTEILEGVEEGLLIE